LAVRPKPEQRVSERQVNSWLTRQNVRFREGKILIVNANTFILALVVITALGFDFTNGFHDTGNAMATSIATGALKPKVAVGISAVANLVGAFLSISVAITVTNAVVKTLAAAKPATATTPAAPAHLLHQNLLLSIVFAGLIG